MFLLLSTPVVVNHVSLKITLNKLHSTLASRTKYSIRKHPLGDGKVKGSGLDCFGEAVEEGEDLIESLKRNINGVYILLEEVDDLHHQCQVHFLLPFGLHLHHLHHTPHYQYASINCSLAQQFSILIPKALQHHR